MKKLIALLLVLAMAVSLAACSGSSEPPKGTITQEKDTSDQAQPTQEQNASGEEQTAEEDNSFSLGSMQGGTYENTYLGFGCTLGDNWTYKTAEELQDISGMTKEMFDGTDLDMSKYNQILDMMAESTDPLATINIQYTGLTAQERLAHAALGEEGVIDATLSQKDLLINTYAQAGITVTAIEKVTVNFCGQERTAVHTTASIEGVGYYILQLFEVNKGPYYATLTLGTFIDDNTSQLLELFYSLES